MWGRAKTTATYTTAVAKLSARQSQPQLQTLLAGQEPLPKGELTQADVLSESIYSAVLWWSCR